MLTSWACLVSFLMIAAAGSTAASGENHTGRRRPLDEPYSLDLTLGLPHHHEKTTTGFQDVSEGHHSMRVHEDTRPHHRHGQRSSHEDLRILSAPSGHGAASSSSHRRQSKKMQRSRIGEGQSGTQVVDLTQGHHQPFSHHMHPQLQELTAFDSQTTQMLRDQSMQMMQQAAHQQSRWGTQEQYHTGPSSYMQGQYQTGSPSYMQARPQAFRGQVQSLPSGSYSGHDFIRQFQNDPAYAKVIQQLEQQHLYEQGMNQPWSGHASSTHSQGQPFQCRYHQSPPHYPPPPTADRKYMLQMQQECPLTLHERQMLQQTGAMADLQQHSPRTLHELQQLQQTGAASWSYHLLQNQSPAHSSQGLFASGQMAEARLEGWQTEEASLSRTHPQYATEFLRKSDLMYDHAPQGKILTTLHWRPPLTDDEKKLARQENISKSAESDYRNRHGFPSHTKYSRALKVLIGPRFLDVAPPVNAYEGNLARNAAARLTHEIKILVAHANAEGKFDQDYTFFRAFLHKLDEKRKGLLYRKNCEREIEKTKKLKEQVHLE